jgi:hypothetical protein
MPNRFPRWQHPAGIRRDRLAGKGHRLVQSKNPHSFSLDHCIGFREPQRCTFPEELRHKTAHHLQFASQKAALD